MTCCAFFRPFCWELFLCCQANIVNMSGWNSHLSWNIQPSLRPSHTCNRIRLGQPDRPAPPKHPKNKPRCSKGKPMQTRKHLSNEFTWEQALSSNTNCWTLANSLVCDRSAPSLPCSEGMWASSYQQYIHIGHSKTSPQPNMEPKSGVFSQEDTPHSSCWEGLCINLLADQLACDQ